MPSIKGIKIARGRSENCGSLEEMRKRKREEQGEGESEEGEIFRNSKKTIRSLDVEKEMGGAKEVEGMTRRLIREELGKVMKEIRKVMQRKKRLRGRKERIAEALTWKERKMRWKLEDIARTEERRGKRIWVGYGKIRIKNQWWCDKNEEVLRDEEGNRRGVSSRKEGRG